MWWVTHEMGNQLWWAIFTYGSGLDMAEGGAHLISTERPLTKGLSCPIVICYFPYRFYFLVGIFFPVILLPLFL